jgi:hypothetical protein
MTARQKQNLTKWIAALRSGEYKQGKNALCSNDEYCCLGVACEIKGKLKISKYNSERKIDKTSDSSLMPDADWFKRTFGFEAYNTCFKVKGAEATTLPILNDQHNLSFKRISNLLEKTFLKD